MNAALQALAHAPELCHALDAESHVKNCPIAIRNERRRKKLIKEGVIPPTATIVGGLQQQSQDGNGSGGTKSHKRSNSASSNISTGSTGSKRSSKKKDDTLYWDPEYEFCTLCEVERLLGRVHSRPEEVVNDPEELSGEGSIKSNGEQTTPAPPHALSQGDGPFVPETFVSGFMSKVAPWFRRGVQEDSHEFLRLLIDAMQTSCKGARPATTSNEESHDGPSRRLRRSTSSSSNSSSDSGHNDEADKEYPFRLFRGTVESNVTCSACNSTSCKIDPFEDVGLDILPVKTPSSSSRGGSSMSSSRSTSPAANMALANITSALERFTSSERLDSGYKCEKCGKLGKATKTSQLASIPPILTLHLKRFRYGSGVGSKRGGGSNVSYNENAVSGEGSVGTASARSSRSSRGGGAIPQTDFDMPSVGTSGSAKIEGHVGFSHVLDMKPYLTPKLQQTFKKAICRLFAVIVHSGKNSHSGHYVSYVLNLDKNEWWKMDDAKVVRSNIAEVLNAEAYMLFYRVTNHPVAEELKSIADSKYEKARRIIGEMRKRDEAKKAAEEAQKAEAQKAAKEAARALQDIVDKSSSDDKIMDAVSNDNEDPTAPSLGKRERPAIASGEDWVRNATTLSPEYLPLFTRIQEFITDNVTFTPEFFRYITEEYNRMSEDLTVGRRLKNNKRIKTLLGKGPGGVYPPEDVVGGGEDIHGGILDLFHQISTIYHKSAGGNSSFILPKIPEEVEVSTAVSDVCASPELIIPQDIGESYDGAL